MRKMPRRKVQNLQERFESYIGEPEESGCILWRGSLTTKGYGQLGVNDETYPRFRMRMKGAHRVAWELYRGPIPNGAWICHRCDNPPCVNPDHLFLGDAKANGADRRAKGRKWLHIRKPSNRPLHKMLVEMGLR